MSSDGFKVIDLVRILREKKKPILIVTSIVFLISIVVSFFILDPIFFSSATVKTTSSKSGLGGLIGGIPDISDLSNITGELGGSTKELALYENILNSRRCIEETIIKFNLNGEWEFKYWVDAIKHFRKNIMEINKDKMAGTMEIGIYDKNPQRAKEIVDFLVYQLNKINTELNVQNAKNNRQFIEQRYNIVKSDLTKAEDSLKNYQEANGIAPDVTIRAVAQSEVEIEMQIKSEEVKLDLLKGIFSPDQSEVTAQIEKINSMKEQLNSIRNSKPENSSLTLKGAPDKIMNFLRLQRDVEIQNKILTFIVPIFEQAKIEENKETPSILILDQAFVADKKSKPKRLIVVAVSTFLAFAAITLFFIFSAKWMQFKEAINNKV